MTYEIYPRTGASSGSSGNATSIQGIPVSASAPSNGDFLVFNQTTGEWEPSDTSFTTLYDIDFTTQPSQVINAALVNIAGVNWTVTNNANLGGQIINGTGLVFTPVVASNVASGIAVSLSTLVGTNNFKRRLRCWARMTRTAVTLGAGANNFGLFGVWWDGNTNLAGASNSRDWTGHQSPVAGAQGWTNFPYGGVVQTNNFAASATDDVMLLESDGLAQCGTFSGVYAAGFPAQSTMRQRMLDLGLNANFNQNPPRRLQDASVAFYIQSQDASFTETITRLVIQCGD